MHILTLTLPHIFYVLRDFKCITSIQNFTCYRKNAIFCSTLSFLLVWELAEDAEKNWRNNKSSKIYIFKGFLTKPSILPFNSVFHFRKFLKRNGNESMSVERDIKRRKRSLYAVHLQYVFDYDSPQLSHFSRFSAKLVLLQTPL